MKFSADRKPFDPRVAAVCATIEKRFREPLTSRDLAQPGIGRRHLRRLFKAQTGMTISSYLRRRRLQEATSLLSETWLRVTEIAPRVGFPDPDYFHRVFKEVYGITPKEFRRRVDRGLFVLPRKR